MHLPVSLFCFFQLSVFGWMLQSCTYPLYFLANLIYIIFTIARL